MASSETAKILAEIISNAEDCTEVYEKLAQEIIDQIQSDDEGYHHIGRQIVQAFRENPEASDNMLMAICGWSMKSLLIFANLIPDDEGLLS